MGRRGPKSRVSYPTGFRSPVVDSPGTLPFISPLFSQGSGLGGRVECFNRERSRRAGSNIPGLLLEDVCGTEGVRRLEAYYRPVASQYLYSEDQISNGDSPVCPGVSTTRRLDVFFRSQRRVPSDTNSRVESPSLEICNSLGGLSIQGAVFWSHHSPPSFYESYGSGSFHPSLPWYKDVEVYRRLVNPGVLERRMSLGEGQGLTVMSGTRNKIKFGKVFPDSCPEEDLFGSRSRLFNFQGFTNSETKRVSCDNNFKIFVLRKAARCIMEIPIRPLGLVNSIDSRGSSEDSGPTTPTSGSLGFRRRLMSGSLEPRLQIRPSLVAPRRSFGERDFSRSSPPRPSVVVRRLGSGLGRIFRQPGQVRTLVISPEILVHQSKGAQSDPVGSPSLRGFVSNEHSGVLRQLDRCRLYEESGRYPFGVPQPGGSGNPALGGGERDHPGSSVHPRDEQCFRRRSLSSQSNHRVRVDSTPGGVRYASKEVAGDNRPLCDLPQLSVSGVFCTSQGPAGSWGRCVPAGLVESPGLCFSSFSVDSKGVKQGPEFKEPIFNPDSSILAKQRMVPRSSPTEGGVSYSTPSKRRSPSTTSLSQVSSKSRISSASCLETMRRFVRRAGFSKRVAKQIGLSRRTSTLRLYQSKWSLYKWWCHKFGRSVSSPSIPKIADFLLFLHYKKKLSISSIKGFRSMLAMVFGVSCPEISSSKVLRDLLRSFYLQRPVRSLQAPSWDLIKVLDSLRQAPYEPLGSCDFRSLTKKTLFLLSLATAKRVGELQALSVDIARVGSDRLLSYLPMFVAKTESVTNPIPRSFRVKSLKEFVGDMTEELLLCPVRALNVYIKRTSFIADRPRSLFVSPSKKSKAISKNAISFFLRETISGAGALVANEGPRPKAHSIRSVATSITFSKNWSVAKVLEAATWRSNSVFASFYLRDVAITLGDLSSLGPIVSAGQVVTPSE